MKENEILQPAESTLKRLVANQREESKKFEQKAIDPIKKTAISDIIKAGYVRDPESKIDIYAKGRGIDPSRYKEVDGKIVFLDPEDKLRSEKTSGLISGAKRFGLETITDPATIIGSAGLLGGGLAGAVVGGVAGESIRQKVAQDFLDEPTTFGERAIESAKSGALEAVGFGAGKAIGKLAGATYRGVKGLKSAEIKAAKKINDKIVKFERKVPGSEYLYGSKEYIADAVKEQEIAKSFGITLNMGQTTGDQQVIAYIRDVASKRPSAEQMAYSSQLQQEQLEESIPTFLKQLFPDYKKLSVVAGEVGDDRAWLLRKASQDAVKNLDINRSKLTKPFYARAFEGSPQVNTSSLRSFIDEASINLTINQKRNINKKIITELPVDTLPLESQVLNLEKLNNLKVQIDDMLYTKDATKSVDKAVRVVLKGINNKLLGIMDEVSPAYENARLIHRLLTVPGSKGAESRRLAQEGLVPLSEFSDKQLESATAFLFANDKMKPAILRNVKKSILKQENGKQIWDNSIMQYLDFVITNSKSDAAGSRSNIGSYMLDAIFGTEQKKKIWKSALSKQEYSTFKDYFRVMQRIGLTFSPSSLKVHPSASSADITEELGSAALSLPQPFVSKESIMAKIMRSLLFHKGYESLSKLLLNPNTGKTLNKILATKNREKRTEMFFQLSTSALLQQTQ